MNKYLKLSSILILSIIMALLIAEGLSRIVFDPIDFLKPRVLSDAVLGFKIEPNSAAHDSWGYRNKFVPETADIVAIGDSHTYGVSATASNSWPSILKKLSGKEVYNISLGGYGPTEYLYLMKDKAFGLKPKIIMVGLYLGNDLKNAITNVYSIPIWEDLRDPEFQFETNNQLNIDKSGFSISNFLARNSVIYRILSSSSIGDYLRQQRRINEGEEITMYTNNESGVSTGFTPDIRLKGLDLNSPDVVEGLRLTLELFNRMNVLSKENDVKFLVIIIPTKESVFSDFILNDDKLINSAKISLLINNERQVNEIIKKYFNQHFIDYIDLLDPLRNASGTKQLYPRNFGGHSNKNGYRIFAETINKHISTNSNY